MQFIPNDSTQQPAFLQNALLLDNTVNVLERAADIHAHRQVALHFPKWTDGRAYSQAVLLRGRLRYTGELIAYGEVLADMLPLLRRCGFDAVHMRADQKLQAAQRALGYFSTHYQTVPSERQRSAEQAAQA
jgi:uncharacterized protein (DUF934 family)